MARVSRWTQYLAVAEMRWNMLRHALRTRRGGLEIGARVVSQGFFALLGLGLGTGLGVTAWQITMHDSPRMLAALLWVVLVVWQVVPVTIASAQQNSDLRELLRFPVRLETYVLLYLLSGLLDISSVVGGIALLGVWVGASVARPELAGWLALALALFAAFNVLLTRMIFAWIDRWLQQRKTRELLALIFVFVLLGVQLLNPAFYSHGRKAHSLSQAGVTHTLHEVDSVQRWLPPGLAADAVASLHPGHKQKSDPAAAVAEYLLLVIYAGAAALPLVVRLRSEYRGESFGEAPAASAHPVHAGGRGLIQGSGVVAAVVEKEIRMLMRSSMLLYQFVAPLVIVFLFSGHGRNGFNAAFGTRGVGDFALPLGVAYSFLGLTRFVYNNFGGEGAGIQFYFLSPAPLRKVVLAKNIVHCMVFLAELVLVCIIVVWRAGVPSTAICVATFCWLLFAVPAQLAVGNAMSLMLPYRLNLTRMGREQGAGLNSILSLVSEVVVVAVGGAVYLPLARMGEPGLAVPILLILAAASIFAWRRGLARTEILAQERQETLIHALCKAV